MDEIRERRGESRKVVGVEYCYVGRQEKERGEVEERATKEMKIGKENGRRRRKAWREEQLSAIER